LDGKSSRKIAFDFIKKVESGGGGGGNNPTPSPVIIECLDDDTWYGKHDEAHTCDYVALNPEVRCNWESSDSILAKVACPVACGTCSGDNNPTPSPVIIECSDDDTWHGKHNEAHTCDYVAKKPEDRCNWESSDSILAKFACPVACGTCSEECIDDDTWHGKYGEAHTCDYIAEMSEVRCNWVNSDSILAKVACPVACGTCPITNSPSNSPTQSPTTLNNEEVCTDSNLDFMVGRKKFENCSWVALMSKRCKRKKNKQHCPITCNVSNYCDVDSTSRFVLTENNSVKNCKWVSKDVNVRCRKIDMCNTCRATCAGFVECK